MCLWNWVQIHIGGISWHVVDTIEAAIVRIMKARKRLQHNVLVTEVCSWCVSCLINVYLLIYFSTVNPKICIIGWFISWLDVIKGRDLRIVFFPFESNFESNRLSDSFSNRIFESNRPYTTQAVTQHNRLLHLQRIFSPSNESDVRTTELRTEYLFISIQS